MARSILARRPIAKRDLRPMHPVRLLREEILRALCRPKAEIARLLGVSRQTRVAGRVPTSTSSSPRCSMTRAGES
jgi:hypothetical protein